MTYQCIRQPPYPASGKSYFIIIVVKESYMSSWYDIFSVVLFVLVRDVSFSLSFFRDYNRLWALDTCTIKFPAFLQNCNESESSNASRASRQPESASVNLQLISILALKMRSFTFVFCTSQFFFFCFFPICFDRFYFSLSLSFEILHMYCYSVANAPIYHCRYNTMISTTGAL